MDLEKGNPRHRALDSLFFTICGCSPHRDRGAPSLTAPSWHRACRGGHGESSPRSTFRHPTQRRFSRVAGGFPNPQNRCRFRFPIRRGHCPRRARPVRPRTSDRPANRSPGNPMKRTDASARPPPARTDAVFAGLFQSTRSYKSSCKKGFGLYFKGKYYFLF